MAVTGAKSFWDTSSLAVRLVESVALEDHNKYWLLFKVNVVVAELAILWGRSEIDLLLANR